MRRITIRLAAWVVPVGIALAVALDLAPTERGRAFAAFLALVSAVLLLLLAKAVGHGFPAAEGMLRAARRPGRDEPLSLAQLESIERLLRLASSGASELDTRFRPLVRQIASAELARKHGVALDRQPERARELAGAHLWQFIATERADPKHPATELPVRELRRLVEELEAI